MKKIIALTLALIMSLSCFSLVSFAEEIDTVEHLTEVPEGYVGIYNKDDLDNIKLDVTGKYILMNDIIFEDSDYVEGGSFYNSGKGWEPIGTTSSNFSGTLDGNNYRIKNLYINNPNKFYVGLFGYAKDATITRVSLLNANITGKDYVGGIVGYSLSDTNILYCNVQGLVSGNEYVGGIAGYQNPCSDLTTRHNNIKYCSNAADIIANTSVGGIVGYSYSYHNTSYPYNYYGYSYIEYCYNIGNISGSSYVGGLVGKFMNYTNYIKHCYSIGTVVATSNYGACFGNLPYSYSFCYYIDEAVKNPTCNAGISKSEDQLKKASTFEKWDFKTIWTTAGREDYPYPEIIGSHPVLPEDGMHKHEYTSEVTTPETHISVGIMTYTCECGDTYTEEIEKIADHSYTSEITIPATHIADGVMTFTCECGDTYTEVINKVVAHDFKATVTEPTCTEHGLTTYTCECGENYTRDYTNALGHKYSSVVTAPTCTTQGYTTYTCECGDSYVADYVNALGHKDHNGDYMCDNGCGYEYEKPAPEQPDENENPSKDCSCNCHKGGIAGLFWKIINFFNKLFKNNQECKCGAKHW